MTDSQSQGVFENPDVVGDIPKPDKNSEQDVE